jgi:hypothetical protein
MEKLVLTDVAIAVDIYSVDKSFRVFVGDDSAASITQEGIVYNGFDLVYVNVSVTVNIVLYEDVIYCLANLCI